jgi:RNA polymerase-binding protein DksA
MPAEPLTEQQLQQLKQRLLDRRAELAAAVSARLHGQDDERRSEAALPRRADETDDEGAAEAQRAADVVHLSRHADELAALDAALVRFEEGTYGVCVDCDEPIGFARLSVAPAAARCAPCQQAHERRVARLG